MVGLIIPFVITDKVPNMYLHFSPLLDSQVSDKQQLLVYSTSYLSFRRADFVYYIIDIAQKYEIFAFLYH